MRRRRLRFAFDLSRRRLCPLRRQQTPHPIVFPQPSIHLLKVFLKAFVGQRRWVVEIAGSIETLRDAVAISRRAGARFAWRYPFAHSRADRRNDDVGVACNYRFLSEVVCLVVALLLRLEGSWTTLQELQVVLPGEGARLMSHGNQSVTHSGLSNSLRSKTSIFVCS